ncbi:MAG TPA: hypothetical protein VIU11_14435 [Nakamurella sp.]
MSTDYAVRVPHKRRDLLSPERDEHVWIAIACFRVSAESLRGSTFDQIHLDRENLATIEVGCYVCEQPWSERLSYRKCPGEPEQPSTD